MHIEKSQSGILRQSLWIQAFLVRQQTTDPYDPHDREGEDAEKADKNDLQNFDFHRGSRD